MSNRNLKRKRITNIRKFPKLKPVPRIPIRGKQTSIGNKKNYINKTQYGSDVVKSKIKDYDPNQQSEISTKENKTPDSYVTNCCGNSCNGCCECEWYPDIINDVSDNGVCMSSTIYNGYCGHPYHCNGNIKECDEMCKSYNNDRSGCITSKVMCCDVSKST